LRRQGRGWALYAALGLLIGVNLALYLPWQLREYHGLYGITARPREILTQANVHNALVIVSDQGGWYDYAVAFSMNAPTLDGDVVYANDCTPRNDELVTQFAGRSVYYFDGQTVRPYEAAKE